MLWPPQDAKYVTAMLPLVVPAVCGAKETERIVPCRGSKVRGRLGPAKLNPVPDVVTSEIVTVDFPLLVTPSGTIRVLPTCTFPTLTL